MNNGLVIVLKDGCSSSLWLVSSYLRMISLGYAVMKIWKYFLAPMEAYILFVLVFSTKDRAHSGRELVLENDCYAHKKTPAFRRGHWKSPLKGKKEKNQKGAKTVVFMLLFLVVSPCRLRKSNLNKKKKLNKIEALFNRFFNEFLKRETFSVPSFRLMLFLTTLFFYLLVSITV